MSRRIILSIALVLASACADRSAPPIAASAPSTEAAPSVPPPLVQSADATSAAGQSTSVARSRDVVRTAEVHLRGANPARIVDAARRWVEAHDGFVDDSNATGVGTATASSRATFRIPSARYGDALRELRSHATVLQVSERGEDVTAARDDAAARIGAKRALEQRLIALTQHAGTVAELIQVENELGRVRADIESMEATQRALVDRIAYATIHLLVDSPEQPLVARAESFGSRLGRSFASGVDVAETLVVGTVALLVSLSPLGAVGILLYLALRITRRRRTAAPRAAA